MRHWIGFKGGSLPLITSHSIGTECGISCGARYFLLHASRWFLFRAHLHSYPLIFYICLTTRCTLQALAPVVSHIIAIDLSPNMIASYNASIISPLAPPLKSVSAIQGNVLSTDGSWAQLLASNGSVADFDVAAICMGAHHFAEPALAIVRLAKLLRPKSGVMLLVDLVKEQGAGGEEDEKSKRMRNDAAGGARHTIHPKHNGFGREEVEGIFAEAGLAGFKWDTCPTRLLMKQGDEVERTLFFARGVRMEG